MKAHLTPPTAAYWAWSIKLFRTQRDAARSERAEMYRLLLRARRRKRPNPTWVDWLRERIRFLQEIEKSHQKIINQFRANLKRSRGG